MLKFDIRKFLEEYGWTVECELPLEIRHEESGSFASGLAAKIVLDYLMEEENNE